MRESSKNMNPYSLEDIERYLQGKMSASEMHELEKAAVQDPFLADAIEGYQSTDLTIVKEDLAGIHEQLSSGPAKIVSAYTKRNTWWRVAAAVILLAGSGIFGWKLFTNKNNTQELAILEKIRPLQKDTVHAANTVIKKEAVQPIPKNDILANNIKPASSLQKNTITEALKPPNKTSISPVAHLAAKEAFNESASVNDAHFLDKTRARELVAANVASENVARLSAQAYKNENRLLSRTVDPATDIKKQNSNNLLKSGNITAGKLTTIGGATPGASQMPFRIKTDSVRLDRKEMPVFSPAGYSKAKEDLPAIVLGNVSASTLTLTGNITAGKEQVYAKFGEKKSATFKGDTVLFDVSNSTKDASSALSEVVVTRPRKTVRKEPGAVSLRDDKTEVIRTATGLAISVTPNGGWSNFNNRIKQSGLNITMPMFWMG
ncbi:MAG: hypothetical protein ABI581_13075, partial [Sediminibacterium sp.]